MAHGLETLLLQTEGLHFLWTGNDGWLIRYQDCLFATDLDLLNPERLASSPVDLPSVARSLNALFITHEHEDHFNMETCRRLAKDGSCVFIVPQSCAEKAKALPASRTILAKPGDTLQVSGIPVQCHRAIHGHIQGSVYSGASTLDCGYRFTFGETTVYQPGDTLLLEEHLSMENTDVLMVSPTEHNTRIVQSRQLISALQPTLILAQHFGTYGESKENHFWTHGYIEELYDALSEEEKARYRIPCPGEILSLSTPEIKSLHNIQNLPIKG